MILNSLKNINLKKKFFICTAIFLLTACNIIYFIIIPAINEIKKTGEEIVLMQKDVNDKYDKITSLKKLTADANKIEPEMAKLRQIFIDKNNQLGFIQELEEIAKNNNVNQSINIGAISDNALLNLSVQGEIGNLYNYLLDIESLNYYVNIKNISISAGAADSRYINNSAEHQTTGNLLLNIAAETYWR